MLEFRVLRYFLAIAREGSITGAAESLHLAQPTLSRQIQDLERQLGKQLFIRGKKKVTLTEEGNFLRSRAQEMLNLMERTEIAFSKDNEDIRGDIFLGAAETPAMDFIAEIFRGIQEDYPQVRFHIWSGDADAVMERLEKGLIDMGLLLGPVEQEKYDYLHLPHADSYGLLMPTDSSLAKKQTLSVDDILGLPLIFPDQTYSGHQRISRLGIPYDTLNVVATYNLLYNAVFLVEQGIGCAFCLEGMVHTEAHRNIVFRPFSPALKLEQYIVTKKYQTFSAAVKLFLERLAQAI